MGVSLSTNGAFAPQGQTIGITTVLVFKHHKGTPFILEEMAAKGGAELDA